MLKKDKNVWKYVVGNIKGAYGETDFTKKTVKINKQYHKSKGDHPPDIKKNKDGSASMVDTAQHELIHKQHPKMWEKTVRKLTPKKVKKLSKKTKQKLLNKFK